jgi:hypothetical protein
VGEKAAELPAPYEAGPYQGRQAAALAPYIGKWVALDTPTSVLVAADRPEDVIAWLARHNKRASYGMFRVPAARWEAEGAGPF